MTVEMLLKTMVDDRLTAAGASPDLNLYSTSNYTTHSFAYNSACWAADFKFTDCSTHNTDGTTGNFFPWTLITPMHLLGESHWIGAPPYTAYFLDEAGTNFGYTVDDSLNVRALTGSPLTIIQLSAPVSTTLHPIAVPDSDWSDFLSGNGNGLPCVYLNAARFTTDLAIYGVDNDGYLHASREVRVADYYSLDTFGNTIITQPPTSKPLRRAAYKSPYYGDSSCQLRLYPDPRTPILATIFHDAGSGSSLAHYADEIDAVLAAIPGNPGYRLTRASLSAFDPASRRGFGLSIAGSKFAGSIPG